MGLFGGKSTTADATIKVGYKGKDAETGLNRLKKTVMAVISIYAIKKLAEYTLGLAKLGAQAEMVEKNFAKFSEKSGKSVDDMMSKLRKATKGMVTDIELQQNAMKAMISGVSFDDLIVAMEYVTNYAAATGSNVSQKMMTVMTGLARGSAMFMDDVGIQVMGAKDVVRATIDQMKEKMDDFALSEEDAAVKAAQLTANWKNQQVMIGKGLIPVYEKLLSVANKVVEAMNNVFGFSEEGKLFKISNQLTDAKDKLSELETEFKEGGKTIRVAGQEFFKPFSKAETVKMIDNIETQKNKVKELKEEFDKLITPSKIEPGKLPLPSIKSKGISKKEEILYTEDELYAMYGVLPPALMEGVKQGLEDREALRQAETQAEKDEIQKRIEIRQQLMNEMIKTDKEMYDKRLIDLEAYFNDGIISQEEYHTLLLQAEDEYNESSIAKAREAMAIKDKMWRDHMGVVYGVTGAMMSLSSTYTDYELNQAKKQSKNSEEYEKKRKEIMQEAAQRQYRFAIWQKALDLAEAVRNVESAIIKAGEFGSSLGVAGAIFSAGLTSAEMFMMLANLQQAPDPPPPNMAMGGLMGKRQRTRQPDNINTMLGNGEYVSDAPTTNKYYNELESMRAGTYDKKYSNSYNYNIYGVSNEQFLQLTVANDRRNRTGKRL